MTRRPTSVDSNEKGREFEDEVECLLAAIAARHPERATLDRHWQIALHDGRSKVVDFLFRYRTLSARNEICIECQHRDRYESAIVDKILAIRANSHHNRFWYVYREESFLSAEAVSTLVAHGIMNFSLSRLRAHLDAVGRELRAAESDASRAARQYEPPGDYAMAPPSQPADRSSVLESHFDGTGLSRVLRRLNLLLLEEAQKQHEIDREVIPTEKARLEAERSVISREAKEMAVVAIVLAVAGDSDADASLLQELAGVLGGDGAPSPAQEDRSPEDSKRRARAALHAFSLGQRGVEQWQEMLRIANEAVAKSSPS